MTDNLENQFHHAMVGVADFANQHHFGIRFRQMIQEHGAVDAAKRLLATQEIQTGLMRLWDMDSLSKSMEALVIQERFQEDVAEQIIAIGQALGFQTEREKLVAKGAQVDVVWQARIANLGVVMYVFEVQSHGSIDSLILNLQRAQVNQSVQRLIVVASAKDIDRIRGEVATLPESFRRAVSYWEAAEAMRAAGLVDELFGVITKLELVKSEFGT